MKTEEELNKETERDYESIWKPLLQTNGKWDDKKIRNEMLDLIFVLNQVSEVYCSLTGGKLSKPMYYAKTIIDAYEDQLQEDLQNYKEDIIDVIRKY